MGRLVPIIALVAWVAGMSSVPARALVFQSGTTGGVMQQPTSQYYLAVYGAYGEVAREDQRFIFRAMYIERPKFSYAGYVDQESGVFGVIGTKLTKAKNHGLSAFVGGGRVGGYVAEEDDDGGQGPAKLSFSLPGLVTVLEYSAQWRRLDVALGHQMFIGYADRTQLESLVAWPYTFFLLRLGLHL